MSENKEDIPDMTSEQIVDCVKRLMIDINKHENLKIRKKGFGEYKAKLEKEYKSFSERYPSLFLMIIEKNHKFDMNKLEHMLGLYKKIEKKEITTKDASIHVGQKYYDEYVKPVIDE